MKIAAGARCSNTPHFAVLDNSPLRKEFFTKCDDGRSLTVICTEGVCKASLLN